MKPINFLMIFLFSVSILITGCKEDDAPTIQIKSQGYIKGLITTSLSDKSSLVENFKYSQYLGIADDDGYIIDEDSSYSFSLSRYDYITNGSGASLEFQLDSPTDVTPSFAEFRLDYSKETSTLIQQFSMTVYSFDEDIEPTKLNKLVITDFSFNPTTGQVKGNV